MRCWICDFTAQAGSNNWVFVDKKTNKEVCQDCSEAGAEALREFGYEGSDEQFGQRTPTVSVRRK